MLLAVAYIISFITFTAIDVSWLLTFGSKLYKTTLGDILSPDIRLAPAVVFYIIYPFGLVCFAVVPGLKQGSTMNGFLSGSLFGAIAYATYELTNFATLRNWTFQITMIDILYGALVSGIVSAVAVIATPSVNSFLGGTPR